MSLWNLLAKAKTKQFPSPPQPQPLTAVAFSADGAWLAYAASYDWGRGVAGHEANSPKVSLHRVSCPSPEALTQCVVTRPVCFVAAWPWQKGLSKESRPESCCRRGLQLCQLSCGSLATARLAQSCLKATTPC